MKTYLAFLAFGLLLTPFNESQASGLAEQLSKKFSGNSQRGSYHPDGYSAPPVRCSVGVVTIDRSPAICVQMGNQAPVCVDLAESEQSKLENRSGFEVQNECAEFKFYPAASGTGRLTVERDLSLIMVGVSNGGSSAGCYIPVYPNTCRDSYGPTDPFGRPARPWGH